MKIEPMVSIIIPAYNCEKTIVRCIKSIEGQSYINIETIIVNDGSSDSTLIICKKMQSSFSNLKVLNKPNGGVSSARNEGLRNIHGDYFMFVDPDDYLPVNAVTDLIRGTKSGAEIVVGSTVKISEDVSTTLQPDIPQNSVSIAGKQLKKFRRWVLQREGAFEGVIRPSFRIGAPWGKLFQSKLKHLRFNESITYSEDLVYINEQLKNIQCLVLVKDVVYNYVHENSSLTRAKYIKGIIASDYALSQYLLSLSDDYDNNFRNFIYKKIIILMWHSYKTGIIANESWGLSKKRTEFKHLAERDAYEFAIRNAEAPLFSKVGVLRQLFKRNYFLFSLFFLKR